MEKFLRIDPHVHSKGISRCSLLSCEEIIDEKMAHGYDGAILTNHCQAWYYSEEEHAQFVENVLQEFARGKAYADNKNFRWYLGLEVSLADPHYADWLLYGVTEEFLRSTPCLYKLSQKELFELCEHWGVLLVQAHPYRQTPCDPKYMHGVEHNCSRTDVQHYEKVREFAEANRLLLTCGTDYHCLEHPHGCGIYVPETCHTAADIAMYVKAQKSVKIFC